jgi:hypothetical protein
MKAIETRFHAPTATLPARISARAEGMKRVFYPADKGHGVAASRFRAACGWSGDMVSGYLPSGNIAWCFVRDNVHI